MRNMFLNIKEGLLCLILYTHTFISGCNVTKTIVHSHIFHFFDFHIGLRYGLPQNDLAIQIPVTIVTHCCLRAHGERGEGGRDDVLLSQEPLRLL